MPNVLSFAPYILVINESVSSVIDYRIVVSCYKSQEIIKIGFN